MGESSLSGEGVLGVVERKGCEALKLKTAGWIRVGRGVLCFEVRALPRDNLGSLFFLVPCPGSSFKLGRGELGFCGLLRSLGGWA